MYFCHWVPNSVRLVCELFANNRGGNTYHHQPITLGPNQLLPAYQQQAVVTEEHFSPTSSAHTFIWKKDSPDKIHSVGNNAVYKRFRQLDDSLWVMVVFNDEHNSSD